MINPTKLIILRGIPGSGKSTYAKGYCHNKDNNTYRVNRDDIRAMMCYSFDNINKDLESIITKTQNEMITGLLQKGKNVMVDNLNLRQSYVNELNRLAEEVGNVEVIEKYFNIPLAVAVLNNRRRGTTVPDDVIEKLYNDFKEIKVNLFKYYPEKKYLTVKQDETLPHCIICDLDGTLALFDREKKNPYDRDFENDEVNKAVQYLLFKLNESIMNEGYGTIDNGYRQIIFVSGRLNKFRDITIEWLTRYGFDMESLADYREGCQLIMRQDNDFRKDSIVKQEIYDKYIKGVYYVDFVLDDRNQVVDMWRRNGLTCLQVAEGNF